MEGGGVTAVPSGAEGIKNELFWIEKKDQSESGRIKNG